MFRNTTTPFVGSVSAAVIAQAPPNLVAWGRSSQRGAYRSALRQVGRLWSSPAILVIGILLLIRLLLLPWALLIPEEAYYWMYSKYPSFGYLDHPPMVAWLIAAGRSAFGDTELGVRIGAWLLAVGSTWLCYRLAADWCGRRTGMVAAVLFNITPLFFGVGFIITPDAPLIFFWLVALLAVTRVYRTGAQGWWLLAGAATGLAFVSKYPAVFLVPSAFLFLLSDARGRRLLSRPGPWLALATALIVSSPVLWWNAQNDWQSFRFQFARRIAGHGGLAPGRTLGWVGTQFGLLSPLVFVLFTAAWWIALRRFRRDHTGRWRFAACFALPWLAVCVWHGLFSKVNINWPLPAYLGLIPVAALLTRVSFALPRRLAWLQPRRVGRRYAATLAAVNAVVLLLICAPIPMALKPNILAPWDELGAATECVEDALAAQGGTEPFIIADGRYNLASELAFYMRDETCSDDWDEVVPVGAVMGGGLNFVNWREEKDLLGRNAIYIAKELKPRKIELLRASFARLDEPQRFFSHAKGVSQQQDYWVINCWALRGLAPELDTAR